MIPWRSSLASSQLLRSWRVGLRWLIIALAIGIIAGVSSAGFLRTLDWATATRVRSPEIILLLSLAGLAIAYIGQVCGSGVESGTNLILLEIREPAERVPWTLSLYVYLATMLTHLFGGSAGREGTAVQIAGSLVTPVARWCRVPREELPTILTAAMSAGFGAVFGTPLAGWVFGMEVCAVGRIRTQPIVVCLIASISGDWVCQTCGVTHTHYPTIDVPPFSILIFLQTIILGIAFGAASWSYLGLLTQTTRLAKLMLPNLYLRLFAGGLLLAVVVSMFRLHDYCGLSLPMLSQAFSPGGVVAWAFAVKLVFTALTLAFGFKGGEVTPLFVVGATLGGVVAPLVGLSVPMGAALGLVAVFGAASNTPIACTLMGIELFGVGLGRELAVACCVAYLVSGRRSIYSEQLQTNDKLRPSV